MGSWPYLKKKQSRNRPPNHLEKLFNFTLLELETGDHRDNFSKRDLIRLREGLEFDDDTNTTHGADTPQGSGTHVLVCNTENTPQIFTSTFPSKHNIMQDTKQYRIVPINQFHCFNGTVTILDPLDPSLRRI